MEFICDGAEFGDLEVGNKGIGPIMGGMAMQ